MRVLRIPYSLVAADNASINFVAHSSHPSSRSQRFSTAHHDAAEILLVVPEKAPSFTHSSPPWEPYGYNLWHKLIARSQGLEPGEYHEIVLPDFLYEDMMRCHGAWVAADRMHQAILAEIIEILQFSKAGKALRSFLDGQKEWFIRFDQTSPKDSPMGGKLPSSTLREIITKLCTSMQAYGCLQREKENAAREGREMSIKLVLDRWDDGMDTAREFRVFVPPPAAAAATDSETCKNFKISAISQYKWPFVFEAPWGFTLEETVAKVETGAKAVLQDIVTYATEELLGDTLELLLKHGFSFDVALERHGNVRLVEINPFGALSGCGACLFNWILDGRVLYGLEEAQFAVTLDEDGE